MNWLKHESHKQKLLVLQTQLKKIIILKRSPDFLLYTKKETSRVLFTIKYGCYRALGPRSRSVLFNLPSAKPNEILSI